MITGLIVLAVILSVLMVGPAVVGLWYESRCCFYEDGKHQCFRFSKWVVNRGFGFEDQYCDRHANMRLS